MGLYSVRVILGLGALLLVLALFPIRGRAEQIVDRVIATVDGDPITMHDLKSYAAANNTPIPPDDSPGSAAIKKRVLSDLIDEKLVDHELSNIQVDDNAVDHFIIQFEVANHITEEQLRAQIAQHGMTYEAYRKRIRQQVQRMEMIEQQVRNKIVITPQQVQAYYKSHIDDYTVAKERYKLAQILVGVEPTAPPTLIQAAHAKAEGLRKRALSGEDFSALARQFSDDDSKSQGGELGDFSPDEILDQVHVAISQLKPGQISEVVRTNAGFHIIKVEEHQRAGSKPLDEVKETIREKLSEQQMEFQFRRWVSQELIKSHSVQTYL